MVMRISENMKFNTIVDNMFKTQDSYNKLAEKIASLKEINRPSDDPIGMNRVLDLRKSRASVEQYIRNIDGCESWLTITESKLSAAGELLIKAREVAIAQSTATASAETRSSEAGTVQQLIDEMLALANSKYDDRYLFSGTKTGEEPFLSSGRSAAEIGAAAADEGNTFDGDVTSSGTYEGLVDKTYVVKVTDWDSVTETATYDVSDDGGATWISTGKTFVLPEGGSVETGDIGDGIVLTFTDNGTADLTADDIFDVQAFAPEYYIGEPVEADGNGDFDGTVTSGGVYSGSVNGTYVVKILTDDEPLATTEYQFSSDGGKTWNDDDPPLIDLSATITLADGVQLTFTEGVTNNLSEDDIFYVHTVTAGYYNGNGEELSVNIGEGTIFAYSISGEAAFTDKGEGNVSVFGILNELKTALEDNDPDGIASCLDDLMAASDQISKNISRCGARMNRLEVAKNNMADMDMDLAGLISKVEDADLAEIITKLAMKEVALNASYALASKIGNLTILNFLR